MYNLDEEGKLRVRGPQQSPVPGGLGKVLLQRGQVEKGHTLDWKESCKYIVTR
jgi:hypothetical protein